MSESDLSLIQAVTSVVSAIATFCAVVVSLYLSSSRFRSRFKATASLGYITSYIGTDDYAIVSITSDDDFFDKKYSGMTKYFNVNVNNNGELKCRITSLAIKNVRNKVCVHIPPSIHTFADYSRKAIEPGEYINIAFPIDSLAWQDGFNEFWDVSCNCKKTYVMIISTGSGIKYRFKLHEVLCGEICASVMEASRVAGNELSDQLCRRDGDAHSGDW